MTNFMLAYHGGKMPESPEEGARLVARWQAWIDGLGDANVDPGNPVGKSWTVSAGGVENNGGANPLSGYSVVNADNVEAAIELAKGCPHLDTGTIEIAEIIPM